MEKFIFIEKSNGSKYLVNPNKIKNIEYYDSDRIWIYYTDNQNDHLSFITIAEAQEAYNSILNQLT